jgi:catechol 2,3-dioxygenase-like lactoylglutathione lyase family enzyme
VFDHVTIRVSDRDASREFYDRGLSILGNQISNSGDDYDEWNDFSLGQAGKERPLTRHLHVAFVAPSVEAVDEFWGVLTNTGYIDDGPPGPRPQYSESYYGAFVLDPDGNSAEAVHHDNPRTDGGIIDHIWMRVRDVGASTAFYETIASLVGFEKHVGRWTHFHVEHSSFTIVEDEPVTENVHLAFRAPDDAIVDEFHRMALAAGYRDNGAPGERPDYHAGYYGAYVLDPDGNNVEVVNHHRH